MSDVADAAKHGALTKRRRDGTRRDNSLSVEAYFEYMPSRGFRFMRNAVTITHVSQGEIDFVAASLKAVQYWMNQLLLSLKRPLAVAEGPDEFHPTAYLYFDPKYCFKMQTTRLKFFEKRGDGTYRLVDPQEVRFEIRELPVAKESN
jgi:hypothetical protein